MMMLPGSWDVVVPVRDFTTAKSRLRSDVAGDLATEVARSLAESMIVALRASPEVGRLLVVSDVDLSGKLSRTGVEHLVQRPDGGLNGAVSEGLEVLGGRPALVIHADLPRVTPTALSELLRAALWAGGDCFLPDAEGTGTTALVRVGGSVRGVAFGRGSAAAHERLGYRRIELPSGHALRDDLDSLADCPPGSAAEAMLARSRDSAVGAISA